MRALRTTATRVLTGVVILLAACTSERSRSLGPGASALPRVLSVPEIDRMLQMGTTPPTILGEMQRSGTVYRLTTRQEQDLRADGMPASLLSQMELIYRHALQKNPALGQSDEKWHQVDGYWYGGLPYGWPRDWVFGAPAPGELLR